MSDNRVYAPDIFDRVRQTATGQDGVVVGFGLLPTKRLWMHVERADGTHMRGTSTDFELLQRVGEALTAPNGGSDDR